MSWRGALSLMLCDGPTDPLVDQSLQRLLTTQLSTRATDRLTLFPLSQRTHAHMNNLDDSYPSPVKKVDQLSKDEKASHMTTLLCGLCEQWVNRSRIDVMQSA